MAPKAKSSKKKKQSATTGPQYTKKKQSSQPPPPPPSSTPHSSTHIRPPPINFGNPTILNLLIDDDTIARYHSFNDRPFVPIHSLSRLFLDSLHIPKLVDLLSCQPMASFLLDNTDPIYPGMVAQFFANLRFEDLSSRNVITSRVNKINIQLDYEHLNGIYKTGLEDPTTTLYYWDDSHLWPDTSDKFYFPALRTLFKVHSRDAKDFNPTNLDPEDRVIYHILHNFINPVAGHFTNPGKIPLVYYYLFTQRTLIDWGFVVFNRLADTITDHRRNLPHAQFLTRIFHHFRIPINEAGIPPHPFDMSLITKKGIRLHQDKWITCQEFLSLTSTSRSSPPPSSSHVPPQSQPSPSSSVLDAINGLRHSINALTNHVRYLEHGLKMIMPAELHEEFESDKILFGIDSESDPEDAPHAVPSSASEDLSSASLPSDDDSDNAPLIHHVKRSKPAP